MDYRPPDGPLITRPSDPPGEKGKPPRRFEIRWPVSAFAALDLMAYERRLPRREDEADG
jgi:hypothetical protein